tara:strand:- start:265 stop:495 length:231 start_codon:yes stop_codon:yes gene_type:complete
MVDFPAPLGPKKPTTSPLLMVKETLFNAFCEPKVFVMFCTVIDIQTEFDDSKNTLLVVLFLGFQKQGIMVLKSIGK